MEIVIFQIIVLVFSVVIHEVAHGVVAQELGDPTAKLAGRLTLNPLKHLDPFGSVILPLVLAILPGGVIFGWAKPVPYNPMNLKNPKKGGALIAFAGPMSNFLVVAIFAALYRFLDISPTFQLLTQYIILINIVLGIFNLVPIPPLDGSKVLFGFLPQRFERVYFSIERFGMLILVFFIVFAINIISPVIFWVFKFFTGGFS